MPEFDGTPRFSDVPIGHWALKYVEYAVVANVVRGYPDGTYLPDSVVNRGQMAIFVARSMVAPAGDAGIPDAAPPYRFPDVPGATNEWLWCLNHVAHIAGQGVSGGYPDGMYHPEYEVTRDQMAVYIQRAFDLPMPPA